VNAHEACQAIRLIIEASFPATENDISVIYETATGHKRFDYTHAVSQEEFDVISSLARRRASGEPLQYICGKWPFLDFEVKVDRRALIPRPETEILAETVINLMKHSSFRAVDLCTGTGVLAFSVKRAFPECDMTAVELSHDALELFRENAADLCLDIKAVEADAKTYFLSLRNDAADLIVCNPPYITPSDYSGNYAELREEPRMAFLGGDDGLDFYRAIIPNYKSKLSHGGLMAFEIGNDQADAVTALFRHAGYTDITVIKDYSSLDRVIYARVN